MRRTWGVALALWIVAASAAAQTQDEGESTEGESGESTEGESGESTEGVPVTEDDNPGVVFVEQPSAPPGYENQPQGQQQPAQAAPTQQPGYGAQQPGYGAQQPGYGSRPTYHREPYVEGMQLPPNATVETRVRKGMIAGGIAMFVAGYVSMVLVYTLSSGFGGDPPGTTLIPAIGPFFLMPDASQDGRILLGLDALLQIGGLTMLVLGATLKSKIVTWYGDSRIRVTPMASRSGGGMGMALSF